METAADKALSFPGLPEGLPEGVKLPDDPVELARVLSRYNCLLWIKTTGLVLNAGPWSIEGHQYQADMLQEKAPRQVCIKGAQMGITEVYVLRTLHGMIHGHYPLGAMYLFPTGDDVRDFSKVRFKGLLEHNKFLARYVDENTNDAALKRIGGAYLYLRGARQTANIDGMKASATKLKSAPVDLLVMDEFDEMDPAMIELAKERLSHSMVQEVVMLGTPTVPDYGVDREFQKSDQRMWMIRCRKCGKYTCLEDEFPNCIHRLKDGRAIRLCMRCRAAEISPADGQWVAKYPDRSKDLVGRCISQLNSGFIPPGRILDLYENPPNGNLAEVMNSKLGRAYVAAENRLTPAEVWRRCGADGMPSKHYGPTAMGVDVGKLLHCVVGERSGRDSVRVLYAARVSTFNDLHDIAKRFHVRCAVLDMFPETRKVQAFSSQENYPVFMCQYSEHLALDEWDQRKGIVRVNRTGILDATHALVDADGKLELPRRCPEMDEFVSEMCGTAKVLEEDRETGKRVYRYRKLGADHYRHALGYLSLACQRIPLAQRVADRESVRMDPKKRLPVKRTYMSM